MKASILLLGALLVPSSLAWAQSEVATATISEAAPAPTTESRVETLEGRLDAMDEPFSTVKAAVDKLSAIQFSGYIQGRFEWHDDSVDRGFPASGAPGSTTEFLVRRGRLKTTVSLKPAELVLQIDANSKGVFLKDAEASLIEPWTGHGWKLTVGQFKWPFGYEILQSSSLREMPERALVIRKLFPAERDRGARLVAGYERFSFQFAVVNGNGVEDKIYEANDSNVFKDVVGRVGFDLDRIVFGASGYYGKALITSGGDMGTPRTYQRVTKSRVGADVEAYIPVPVLGGLAAKGEIIYGEELGAKAFGWWALLVQNLGDKAAIFARLDRYDPNVDAGGDATLTLGGGAEYFFSAHLKASAVYEHPINQGTDKDNDILTAQLQAGF